MGESVSRNFIERIIDSDIESGKNGGAVVTLRPNRTAISTSDTPNPLI